MTLSIRPLRPAAGDLNRFSTYPDLTAKDDLTCNKDDLLANTTAVNGDQTKELLPLTSESSGTSANQLPVKSGVSFAKQATEKLKWKFLGW